MGEDLAVALAQFVQVFDAGDIWVEIGSQFTCTEAEAMAELLRAIGLRSQADCLMADHAAGDECGDMHHACEECFADFMEANKD